MRTTLLTLAVVGLSFQSVAQCTPNPLYADSLFGVWPDTTTNFAPAQIGVFYSDTMNLIVPNDAGAIDPAFTGVQLDSVQMNSIIGMPPGIVVYCNSQTGNSCTYLTAVLGCGLLEGTPTQMGTFPLTIDVTAYAFVFGSALPIPYQFTGYSITVGPSTVSITENTPPGFSGVRNTPNPFAERTTLEFDLDHSGSVVVQVFDLLGAQVRTMRVAGRKGANRVLFPAEGLEEGIYLYTLTCGDRTFTDRMVIAH